MTIKITADSTCDLPADLVEQYDITILPLYVTAGDKTYRDGVNVTMLELFNYVERSGSLPSTAAVNVADYQECFAQLAGQYDAVIHINISSEFSSCYQNATIAAQDFDNVYVVDSRNLSTGHGHVVLQAAQAAQRGLSPAEIVDLLADLIPRVESSFVVDKLDFLVKGGRCSSAAALGANLLQLKPCIEVSGGQMHVGKKYRGSFEKALGAYIKDRLAGRDDLDPERVFITHTPCPDGVVDAAKAAVARHAQFRQITETGTGATIACHCGPSTLGILFIRSK